MIIKIFDGYESKYRGTEVDEAVGRAYKAALLEADNIFLGSNEFQGPLILGSLAVVETPDTEDDSDKVANTAFVKAQGYLTSITSEMISAALGYVPYSSENPAGYISGITSNMVITALGYTPEDNANKVVTIDSNSTDVQYPSAKAVYSVTNANTTAINTINSKIPSAASPSNPLTDKDFVNSSIATSTATFRGTFNSLADLEAYSGPKDDNDYAFVVTVDSAGNTLYNRYKYTGTQWLFEYSLNNSSFTAIQWAAVNSGANTNNIAQIATNTSLIGDLQTSKQDKSAMVQTINSSSTAAQYPSAQAVYNALDSTTSVIFRDWS